MIVNNFWDTFYDQYKKAFKIYDENEEQRLTYTRNTVTYLLKYLSEIYTYSHDKDENGISARDVSIIYYNYMWWWVNRHWSIN